MSDKELKEVDFEKLKFIRVFTPIHIPKELIEQIKRRKYEVEDWFKYQEAICLRKAPSGMELNPLSMLFAIADDGNRVVGVLWCEIDPLGKTLVIKTFSMDRSYWFRGKAVKLLSCKAKEILKECKLDRIVWFTNYPKHSEHYGFKRCRSVLMEYTEVESGRYNDGRCESFGERSSDDERTESTISSRDSGIRPRDESASDAINAGE
jgi:hypothetical protein